jgi:(1->4)-alpha-D-glucan 1-alpha-D-glucosylmutase
VFAFARRHETGVAIVSVPRLVATLTGHEPRPPLGGDIWEDTAIVLPSSFDADGLWNAFTGEAIPIARDNGAPIVGAAAVFESFPIALLVSTASAANRQIDDQAERPAA